MGMLNPSTNGEVAEVLVTAAEAPSVSSASGARAFPPSRRARSAGRRCSIHNESCIYVLYKRILSELNVRRARRSYAYIPALYIIKLEINARMVGVPSRLVLKLHSQFIGPIISLAEVTCKAINGHISKGWEVGKDHVVNSRFFIFDLKRKLLESWHSTFLKHTWDHLSSYCIKPTLHQTWESIRPNKAPFHLSS